MRDTVSIIFAAIFMVLAVIILPLFSILDRQDNISYNVVLTQTTKFVDEIRTNGFITQQAYESFISTLASTGNTYKVTLEAYKHSLIPSSESPDVYIDELELYNTQDIIDHITGAKTNIEVDYSNKKEKVYLFEKSDEIYVRVYNTNITAGSVMYNMLMGGVNTKVIDITYGGAVNNVNWELYDKIEMDTIATPQVTLSVPVNANNSINVYKMVTDAELKSIECVVEDYGGLFADPYEMCSDIGVDDLYKYIYDIDQPENQTITVAVRFEDVEQLQVREQTDLEYVYGDTWGLVGILLDIFDLKSYKDWDEIVSEGVFDSNTTANKNIEQFIIDNFIRLNGMTADVNLTRTNVGSYHAFNIVLTNVKMVTIGALTEKASIAVLPGLGRNAQHELTVGDETVMIELGKETDERDSVILGPYNWKQFLKTKSAESSIIEPLTLGGNKIVYINEEIFFKIQYTGIKDLDPAGVVNKIRTGLSFNRDNPTNEQETLSVTYYTPLDIKNAYGITIESDTIIVKFTYGSSFETKLLGNRYLNLGVDWYPGMEQVASEGYLLDKDTADPQLPTVSLMGDLGENDWYVSDVEVQVANNGDTIQTSTVRSDQIASGVYESTVRLSGGQTLAETDAANNVTIDVNTTPTNPVKVHVKTKDYVGNDVELPEISVKVDKQPPSTPGYSISPSGTPAGGWYTEDVTITITAGSDAHSGLNRTTYEIEGANAKSETNYTSPITLSNTGISTVTIRNYDNAGNTSTKSFDIKIDKGEPAIVTFENINGLKRDPDKDWYHTDVETRITVHYTGSATQKKPSAYKVTNEDGDDVVALTEFSEEIKDIILSGNGIYTVTVYTYTIGGDVATYTHTVHIDGDAPNEPTLSYSGTKGKLDDEETVWYTTDVTLTVTLGEDVGPSGVTKFDYIISENGGEEVEVNDVEDGETINFTTEGTTYIKIIIEDEAGNPFVYEEEINIDKTAPTAAQIVIDAASGSSEWFVSEWYISDVVVSHAGSEDSISGISKVAIKTQTQNADGGWEDVTDGKWEITSSTDGTKIILTTYNGAGLSASNELVIKIDKEEPTPEPVISLTTSGVMITPDGSGIKIANKPVTVTITPSNEVVTGVESGLEKTYYRVTEQGQDPETVAFVEGTSITLNPGSESEKFYAITARTYDVAGNYIQATEVVSVNTKTAAAPVIQYVNGLEGASVSGTDSGLTVTFGELTGTKLDIYVNNSLATTINATDYTIEPNCSVPVSIGVNESVTVYAILTDMFGVSTGASNVVTYTRIEEGS